MLRKKTAVNGFVWLFLLPVIGWAQGAQSSQAQQILKIAFVRGLDVLYATEEGKIEISQVQTFINEKQKEFDSRRAELDRQRQQFETNRATLNPQAAAGMQREIEEKDRILRRFQEDTQIEINRRREELTASLQEKSGAIIREYAEQNKMQVLFLLNDSAIYVDPALDVTQEILRIYNEKYPVSQPAAAPTPQ